MKSGLYKQMEEAKVEHYKAFTIQDFKDFLIKLNNTPPRTPEFIIPMGTIGKVFWDISSETRMNHFPTYTTTLYSKQQILVINVFKKHGLYKVIYNYGKDENKQFKYQFMKGTQLLYRSDKLIWKN